MFSKRKTFSLVFVILVMWAKTLEGVAQNGKKGLLAKIKLPRIQLL